MALNVGGFGPGEEPALAGWLPPYRRRRMILTFTVTITTIGNRSQPWCIMVGSPEAPAGSFRPAYPF